MESHTTNFLSGKFSKGISLHFGQALVQRYVPSTARIGNNSKNQTKDILLGQLNGVLF
jgi:hypothetical protein